MIKKGKFLSSLFIILCVITVGLNVYAHSGRTDSSGGHKDNKNKSGLGSYHYHCGGHPPHLHSNGVCPYSSSGNKNTSSSSSSKSTASSSSSSSKTKTVNATKVEIDTKVENLEIGESKILTATITPSNTINKAITWESSNQSVATVNSDGKVTAKRAGVVEITAKTSNGKTNSVKITVKEKQKEENVLPISTLPETYNLNKNTIENNTVTKSSDNSNIGGIVVAISLLGGIGYLGFKK